MSQFQSTLNQPDHQADTQFSATFGKWLAVFWSVIIYVSAALSLYATWVERPDLLRGWTGLGLLALLVVFGVMYHFVYMRCMFVRPCTLRLLPTRRTVVYFATQFVVLALLLRYNVNFGWLGWSLFGHIVSTMPLKHWPLPLLAVFAIIAAPIGLYAELQRGEWIYLIIFIYSASISVALALMIYTLFGQRHKLTLTVHELRQAKQTLEQQAAQAEELATLRERTRLAREMHDSLGHALVVVNVKLEAAQRLYAVDAARGEAELEATKAVVRNTMGELRRSLADLRAPFPDHQDLPTALHHMADEIRSRSNLDVTCSTTTNGPAAMPDVSQVLWRVAREALANVERHAAATSATLALERSNGSLVLRVLDNGVGITQHAIQRPGHYGITGMRERVEALGGAFHVARRPEGGTVVEAQVPVSGER